MIHSQIQEKVAHITLQQREIDIIRSATADIVPILKELTELEFLDTLAERAIATKEKLPELCQLLGRFTAHESGVVLLIYTEDNVPIDEPTPYIHAQIGRPQLFEQDILRGFVLGCADLYGYGFTTQQGGNIHNNIVPVKEHAETVGHNASSKYDLALHNEVASYNLSDELDVSPDFLTLHYFRNLKHVPTVVAFPDWDQIPFSTLELLKETWLLNPTSPAQGGQDNNAGVLVSPIYGPSDDPWIRVSTANQDYEQYSNQHLEAFNLFIEHLEARKISLPIFAGTIALIDNRRALHGRPAYPDEHRPQYDGTDRWQRRITASADREKITKYEVSSRVVDVRKFISSARNRNAEEPRGPSSIGVIIE